jgi:hypothetical protein
MADFRHRRPVGTVQAAVDDQPAADTGSDRDVKHCRGRSTGPEAGFGECRRVAVVGKHRRDAEGLAAPIGQGRVVPTAHLMALQHAAGGPVDGTAEANADPLNDVSPNEVEASSFYLRENARRAPSRVDLQPNQFDQRAAMPVPDTQLQFGAANFNPEKHRAYAA